MSLKTLYIEDFAATEDNETYLSGTDEDGKEFSIIFNTIELMEWLDIPYMKEQSKKYIDNL